MADGLVDTVKRRALQQAAECFQCGLPSGMKSIGAGARAVKGEEASSCEL